MAKGVTIKNLSIHFPHLGNNFLSLYILLRLFQWVSFFGPLPDGGTTYDIWLFQYEILFHITSALIGLLLLFRVKYSPWAAQFYQVILVGSSLATWYEGLLGLLIHGVWIIYFRVSNFVKEVYG